jgi:hypothetical protein
MRYYHPPRPEETALGILILEVILIPIFIGTFFHSFLLFLLLLIGLIVTVFYYKIKIVMVVVAIGGIIGFAIIGWFFGEFLSILISPNEQFIGGIFGAILFGVIALGYQLSAIEQIIYH